MKSTTRFLVALLLLLTASISQPVSKNMVGTDASVISASTTTIGNNIDANVLNRIPVSRNVNGLLTLGPGVVHETNVPTDSRITATSQFIDNSELQVLIRVDGVSINTLPSLRICDLEQIEAFCVVKGSAPLSLSPAVQYGGNATSGVINIVTKSGGMEFSQGRAFNPNQSKFKSAKFPFYYAPEKDFPLGAISSAGVSGDGSASFQILNFPGNSFFFFRQNNAQFRPIGQFTKIPLGNERILSHVSAL